MVITIIIAMYRVLFMYYLGQNGRKVKLVAEKFAIHADKMRDVHISAKTSCR